MAALVAASIIAFWWASPPRQESEAALFGRFSDACRRGDALDAYRDLLAWLDRSLPESPEPRLDCLVARSGDLELAAGLADLEAVRDRRPGSIRHASPGWSGRDLERRVGHARRVLRLSSLVPGPADSPS